MTRSNSFLRKTITVSLMLIGALIWSLPLSAETTQEAGTEKIWSQDKRFVDNGDGTITDTKTNLMWMKQDSYQQTGHWVTWIESFDFVKKANEKGSPITLTGKCPRLKI